MHCEQETKGIDLEKFKFKTSSTKPFIAIEDVKYSE